MGCITCELEKLGHGSCGERDEGIPCGILLYLYAYNVDTDASLLEVDYAHKKACCKFFEEALARAVIGEVLPGSLFFLSDLFMYYYTKTSLRVTPQSEIIHGSWDP